MHSDAKCVLRRILADLAFYMRRGADVAETAVGKWLWNLQHASQMCIRPALDMTSALVDDVTREKSVARIYRTVFTRITGRLSNYRVCLLPRLYDASISQLAVWFCCLWDSNRLLLRFFSFSIEMFSSVRSWKNESSLAIYMRIFQLKCRINVENDDEISVGAAATGTKGALSHGEDAHSVQSVYYDGYVVYAAAQQWCVRAGEHERESARCSQHRAVALQWQQFQRSSVHATPPCLSVFASLRAVIYGRRPTCTRPVSWTGTAAHVEDYESAVRLQPTRALLSSDYLCNRRRPTSRPADLPESVGHRGNLPVNGIHTAGYVDLVGLL